MLCRLQRPASQKAGSGESRGSQKRGRAQAGAAPHHPVTSERLPAGGGERGRKNLCSDGDLVPDCRRGAPSPRRAERRQYRRCLRSQAGTPVSWPARRAGEVPTGWQLELR